MSEEQRVSACPTCGLPPLTFTMDALINARKERDDARTELTSLRAVAEERRVWIKLNHGYNDEQDVPCCVECDFDAIEGHAPDCAVPRLIAEEDEP